MGQRIEDQAMNSEPSIKLVQHGDFVVKVAVTLLHDRSGWSPYLSHEDMLKLDDAREALRRGDIAGAARYGQVFELKRVA